MFIEPTKAQISDLCRIRKSKRDDGNHIGVTKLSSIQFSVQLILCQISYRIELGKVEEA